MIRGTSIRTAKSALNKQSATSWGTIAYLRVGRCATIVRVYTVSRRPVTQLQNFALNASATRRARRPIRRHSYYSNDLLNVKFDVDVKIVARKPVLPRRRHETPVEPARCCPLFVWTVFNEMQIIEARQCTIIGLEITKGREKSLIPPIGYRLPIGQG